LFGRPPCRPLCSTCYGSAGCGPTIAEQAADVFAQGRLHHENGNLEKAIACYSLAIELDPNNAEVYIHRAEARFANRCPGSHRRPVNSTVFWGSQITTVLGRAERGPMNASTGGLRSSDSSVIPSRRIRADSVPREWNPF